ncbi:CubicO group peptidase, beta-lactamase class C family [Salinimicrobium catena]|uniref:CubicO group peptidase, beta-lactamase class C family n=1 Tax=Salinimicrobium catena TaxID=390640 RepID=A0A1H5MYJ1_9FLAO|nr:serine hydrolase [Salinimicrobium catena]SDL31352.1 CubicO group peptidase, beta-lactamase class C family [Salinimicrobium catena]SEE93701.1 CubicO group peptidase, beta-lactamase class C family [Salinimicrobium catena]
MKLSRLLFCLFLLFHVVNGSAQEKDLHQKIMKMDSLLFEEGFNKCNMEALKKITAEDLEFYHDQGGIILGKSDFIETTRKNICSINYKPIRKLDKESLEVFPLKSNGKIYGAIQSGIHEFYAKEEGKEPYLTSTAKFTHLWLKQGEKWLLKRVLSYDHRGPEDAHKNNIFEDRSTVETWLRENRVPALGLAVLKDYKLKEVKIYGELEENVPAPIDAIFNVASLTKPIVSVLTLKLVNNGDWDLDTPVSRYWTDPDVKDDPNSRLLTTRHILSHQSGFKNWRWENNSGKLAFDFEPGTGFNYSGEGFEYLQKALESKFGKPLEVLADSLLFQPLEMKDTHFYWKNSVEEDRFAQWHNSEGVHEYQVVKDTSASAADDLLTTMEDYGKFAEYVLNGAGLSKELFQEMTSDQLSENSGIKMGLGWELLPNLKGNEYAILHTGGDKGVFTLIMLLPETGEGVVMFTNGDNGNKLSFKIIEAYLSLGKQITGKSN